LEGTRIERPTFLVRRRRAANVWGVRVDQVLERQTRVDKHLDGLGTVPVAIAVDPGRVVGHLVEHLAVCMRKPRVVLEEITVAVDVGDDELLIEERVGFQQIGVTRVRVDHHLVDLLQTVGVTLGQLLVLGTEPPVGISQRKAAESGQHAHLFVVDNLEDRRKEIEAVLAGPLFDFILGGADFRGKLANSGRHHGDLRLLSGQA
jgi:hypothetical protein